MHRAPRSRRRRPGGLLWQRNFRLLWVGETVNWVGDFMAIVGMPLLAVNVLHASNFAVGALVAAGYLPWLVIGLPAGAWIDRMPSRPVMIVCDLLSAVLFLSILLSAWAGVLTLAQVMIVAFGAGTASVFFGIAYQVYLPDLVTADELMEANAKLGGSQSAAELAGPGLAGLAAQALGVTTALLGNAVSFLVSALCLLGTRPRAPERPPSAERSKLRNDVATGVRFVAGDHYLWRICLAAAIANTALCGFEAVQVVFLVRALRLAPAAVGVLVAVPGVGGILGATYARRISERIGTARSLLLAFLCAQPLALLAPLATRGPGIALYVTGLLIMPVGAALASVMMITFRQAYTPSGMLGRVSATMRAAAYGGRPVGALAGGALATTLGPRAALWIIFAVLSGSGTLLFSRPFITVRDLPTTPAPAPGGLATAGSG